MKDPTAPPPKRLAQTEDGSTPLLVQNHPGGTLLTTRKKVAAVVVGTVLCASIIIWWPLAFPTSAFTLRMTCRRDAKCASDFVNSESGNYRGWQLSSECERFVAAYVSQGQYESDLSGAAMLARDYYSGLQLAGDGLDVIVLDIDETSLLNMPYYKRHRYGAENFDPVAWDNWVRQSAALAVKPTLKLYWDLQAMGYKVAFITGRSDDQRNATVANLLNVGYADWLDLHMRAPWEGNQTAEFYKSGRRQALEESGYRIRGSVGDQWSDITGPSSGNRTFKLPNPMYYIA